MVRITRVSKIHPGDKRMADTYQLQYLTGKRLKVFLAVADRIVPPDDASPGAGTMETAGVVDWALGKLDPDLRKLFLIFLLLVEYLGIIFGGLPFSKNSARARDRQLRWMESCGISKFRMGFFGIKSYVCMGYYPREDLWETFEYGGPHVPERAYPDNTIRLLCQRKLEVVE